jgi:hypothetical protein
MRYSDLTDRAESVMRSLLDFLGERYAAQCSEPLAQRINSSNVPVDFNPSDAATNPAIVEQAKKLSDELQSFPQQDEPSLRLAEQLEAEFNQRAQYYCDLEQKYCEAQKLITKLQKE